MLSGGVYGGEGVCLRRPSSARLQQVGRTFVLPQYSGFVSRFRQIPDSILQPRSQIKSQGSDKYV